MIHKLSESRLFTNIFLRFIDSGGHRPWIPWYRSIAKSENSKLQIQALKPHTSGRNFGNIIAPKKTFEWFDAEDISEIWYFQGNVWQKRSEIRHTNMNAEQASFYATGDDGSSVVNC